MSSRRVGNLVSSHRVVNVRFRTLIASLEYNVFPTKYFVVVRLNLVLGLKYLKFLINVLYDVG